MSALARLADVFAEVADTLVADFDVIDFLHTVAEHARELSDAAAAGLMLTGPDESLHHVGATSDDARLLELFQLQNSEGPCLDSFRSGEPVVSSDPAAALERWPNFTPRALEAGFNSVYAFPMRLRGRVIGTLNVFSEGSRLSPDQVRVVQALADVATIGLIQERAIKRAELLTDQLQTALTNRVVIEQAKGAVARSLGISVEEAFSLLRAHARATRTQLTDLAHEVVTSPRGPGLLDPDE